MIDHQSSKKNIPQIALILGVSLILGAIFQGILRTGNFWLGSLAASALIFLSAIAIYFTWYFAKGGKTLAWMLFLAFILRLAYGVFLAWGLPRFGYETPPQQAGFVYHDPFRREASAWALAQSEKPITQAFSNSYVGDQYGGMLAMSAIVYRYISPDAYRPWLISILTAGAIAISIPFLIAAIRQKFDGKTALLAGWIVVLYPEGLLLGSSQMREPYFILCFSLLFWAAVQWLKPSKQKLATGIFMLSAILLLLLSFRVAVPIIGIILLWVWTINAPDIKRAWLKNAFWFVFILGLAVYIWYMFNWVNEVFQWDTLVTIRRSGMIQAQLERLPPWLSFPFVLIYGLFQPVFPAAVAAPAPWIWRSLAIFRALGWYATLPLLAYALVRVWRLEPSQKKRWLIVIIFMVLFWIFIASARAGGDQWDNPRYRTIFLPWIALVSAWSITYAKQTRDRWLTRVLIVEGIFLIFFTTWYIARYYRVIPMLNFLVMVGLIVLLSGGVMVGGWLRDKRQASKNS